MEIKVFDKNYKLIENYNDAFNEEEFMNLVTDYFIDFDYIVGDISYSKLRLKGFAKKGNKLHKDINDSDKIKEYIEENCAYGCKYFVLEKENV